MTVGGKKTFAHIIDFLQRKWTYVIPGKEALVMSFFLLIKCLQECVSGNQPIILSTVFNGEEVSWTKETGTDQLINIFEALGVDIDHSFLQLFYSWPIETTQPPPPELATNIITDEPLANSSPDSNNIPSPNWTFGLDSPSSDLGSSFGEDLFPPTTTTTTATAETQLENVAQPFPTTPNSLFSEHSNDGIDRMDDGEQLKNKDELEAKSFYKHFEPSVIQLS